MVRICHNLDHLVRKRKPAGITPMMVCATPPSAKRLADDRRRRRDSGASRTPWLRTSVFGAAGLSSPSWNTRPSQRPRAEHVEEAIGDLGRCRRALAAAVAGQRRLILGPDGDRVGGLILLIAPGDEVRVRQRKDPSPSRPTIRTAARRSAIVETAAGSAGIAWTTVKIAVVAPMPRASVRMATAAKPGA